MKTKHSSFDWILIGATVFAAVLIVAPILYVVILSIYNEGRLTLQWYQSALQGPAMESGANTFRLAFKVGLIGTMIGGVSALNWWNRPCREMIVIFAFAVAALPGQLYAIGLMRVFFLFGIREAAPLALIIAHVILVIPFCMILIMAGLSYVKENQVAAGLELSGGRRSVVAWSIVLPVVWPSFLSAFVVAFLISANEFVRTSYLSGATQYLSEYIYGKMSSGTDPSTYALGGINISVAFLAVAFITICLLAVRKRASG